MTDPLEWLEHAKCRGMAPKDGETEPNLFFDPLPKLRGAKPVFDVRARRACSECPVKAECLDDALSVPEKYDLGFRAGLTEQERIRERKARRRGAA